VKKIQNYDIYYWIEWGDNTVEQDGWIGPYESGEEVILNHEWDESGTYTIRAKAKNILDEESDWGELRVSMPRSKNQNILHILKEVIERMLWDLNILKP